jgi:hypothetical protein
MKKYAMLLMTGFFMFGLSVSAQMQSGTRPNAGERQERAQGRQQQTPEQRAESVARDLNLSDAEKTKVTELFVKQNANTVKFRADVNRDSPDFRQKMTDFRAAQDAELEALIGKEKFQQLQTIREERRKQRNPGQ